ncbi:MAG TPA: purine-nucleoside phosphorylase [Verrucomicrobiae bacterium]
MGHKVTDRNELRRAVGFCRRVSLEAPPLAIVLGSCFGNVAEAFQGGWVPTGKIPGCPKPSVPGHAGRWGWGNLGKAPVLLIAGRVHYYERRNMAEVTFAIRTLAEYGVRNVLFTNAAGCLNARWRCGDLMQVRDHINFMGVNPLCEMGWKSSEDFVDLSATYDGDLREGLLLAAIKAGIKLREGVYLAVSGPSYETPAEIRAFRQWGADAVGMSTVPEAIVARRYGMKVAALSCLTNMAAGLTKKTISHDEVMAAGSENNHRNSELIRIFAQKFAPDAKAG